MALGAPYLRHAPMGYGIGWAGLPVGLWLVSHSIVEVLLEVVDSPGPTGFFPSKGPPWRQGWASAADPGFSVRAAPFRESCPGGRWAVGGPESQVQREPLL